MNSPTGNSFPPLYMPEVGEFVNARYIHYRVWIGDVPWRSKTAFSNDHHLGRILATDVAPPQTVDSLKRCITRVEGIVNSTDCDLFTDLSSDKPMSEGRISILGNDSLGSTPGRAMALVYSSSTQEIIPSETASIVEPMRGFSRTAVAKQDYKSSKKRFLSLRKGEILSTDGVARRVFLFGSGASGGHRGAGQLPTVYKARNAAGKRGLVMQNAVELQ